MAGREAAGEAEDGRHHVPDKNNSQSLGHLVRQILDILRVRRREEHRLDSRAEGADELLLDAAHRQHAAAEADLARHRHRRWDRLAREE